MKTYKLFLVLFAFVMVLSLVTCSKSSKSRNGSDGSNSSESNGNESNKKGNNSKGNGKGIKITMINIPSKDEGNYFGIYLFDKEEYNADSRYVIFSDWTVNKEKVHNGSIDLYLYDYYTENPWTEPGEYYIKIGDGSKTFYTEGKSLNELGIKPPDYGSGILSADMKKFPTYNLKATGNTIDYSKSIIEVSIDSSVGIEKDF